MAQSLNNLNSSLTLEDVLTDQAVQLYDECSNLLEVLCGSFVPESKSSSQYSVCSHDHMRVVLLLGRNYFCQGKLSKSFTCFQSLRACFGKEGLLPRIHPLHAVVLIFLAIVHWHQKKSISKMEDALRLMLEGCVGYNTFLNWCLVVFEIFDTALTLS